MSSPSPNQKLIDAVLARASLDATFRRNLLLSPDAAIYEAFGLRLPSGLRIKFMEKEPGWDEVYMLPDLQEANEELSDDDLDAVAGGQQVAPFRWDGGDPE